MRFIGSIFILLPVVIYLIRHRHASFFSPGVTFSWLYVIKVVIAVLIFSNTSNVDKDNSFLQNALLSDDCFFEYCILQSLGYCLIIWGINIVKIPKVKTYFEHVSKYNRKLGNKYRIIGYIFYIIGVVAFMSIMNKVGGILFFFTNLQHRRSLVEDLDFENMLLPFLNYAPLLLLYSKSLMRKKIGIIDILLILLAGIMTGLGGRKALLMIVIGCVFVYNFSVKPVVLKRFLKIKYIFGAFVLLIFFLFYSKLRSEGAAEQFVSNPTEFFESNKSDGITNALTSESYVPFFVGVVYHFKDNNYWLGSSFTGLVTAFIPSSLYPSKPPVDDGMYLYSIGQGRRNIKPVMPTKSLDYTSWPLETFGSMYANFGPLGVLLGMLLVGLVIGWFYKKMVLSNFNFFYIAMYIQILFTFEISTLRIVQIIISYILLNMLSLFINRKFICLGK